MKWQADWHDDYEEVRVDVRQQQLWLLLNSGVIHINRRLDFEKIQFSYIQTSTQWLGMRDESLKWTMADGHWTDELRKKHSLMLVEAHWRHRQVTNNTRRGAKCRLKWRYFEELDAENERIFRICCGLGLRHAALITMLSPKSSTFWMVDSQKKERRLRLLTQK